MHRRGKSSSSTASSTPPAPGTPTNRPTVRDPTPSVSLTPLLATPSCPSSSSPAPTTTTTTTPTPTSISTTPTTSTNTSTNCSSTSCAASAASGTGTTAAAAYGTTCSSSSNGSGGNGGVVSVDEFVRATVRRVMDRFSQDFMSAFRASVPPNELSVCVYDYVQLGAQLHVMFVIKAALGDDNTCVFRGYHHLKQLHKEIDNKSLPFPIKNKQQTLEYAPQSVPQVQQYLQAVLQSSNAKEIDLLKKWLGLKKHFVFSEDDPAETLSGYILSEVKLAWPQHHPISNERHYLHAHSDVTTSSFEAVQSHIKDLIYSTVRPAWVEIVSHAEVIRKNSAVVDTTRIFQLERTTKDHISAILSKGVPPVALHILNVLRGPFSTLVSQFSEFSERFRGLISKNLQTIVNPTITLSEQEALLNKWSQQFHTLTDAAVDWVHSKFMQALRPAIVDLLRLPLQVPPPLGQMFKLLDKVPDFAEQAKDNQIKFLSISTPAVLENEWPQLLARHENQLKERIWRACRDLKFNIWRLIYDAKKSLHGTEFYITDIVPFLCALEEVLNQAVDIHRQFWHKLLFTTLDCLANANTLMPPPPSGAKADKASMLDKAAALVRAAHEQGIARGMKFLQKHFHTVQFFFSVFFSPLPFILHPNSFR
ncbi:hypothetical protein Pelo_16427 [Pelomyxa schiedti]|nr:hypothetical protein Pelo_16427 [Pelomyxa schiedti]